jgi:hypothetical protein
MDERRRTISSEEQIGEALMRVSNTLEAERLTKSLDYQEKLRSRQVLRTVLTIILICLCFGMLAVGVLCTVLLIKFQKPILEDFIPFCKNMLAGMGTMWDNLVESSNYMPVMLEQMTRLNEELITMLHNMNQLDLKAIMDQVTALLANTNSMLGTLNSMLAGAGSLMSSLSPMLKAMAASFGSMMSSLANAIGSFNFSDLATSLQNMLSQFGLDPAAIKTMLSNIGSMITDMATAGSTMAKAGASIGTTLAQVTTALSSSIDPTKLAQTLDNVNSAITNGASAMSTIAQTMASEEVQTSVKTAIKDGAAAASNMATAAKNLSDLIASIKLPSWLHS